VTPDETYYVNQTVTAPSNVTSWTKVNLDYDSASYTFTTNEGSKVNVNDCIKVTENPTITVTRRNKNYAEGIYLYRDGVEDEAHKIDILKSSNSNTTNLIRPGSTVLFTATAKTVGSRYYNLTCTASPTPSGFSFGTSGQTRTATFIMGTDNLTLQVDYSGTSK
jgi:hypothetical protein